jgi:hypothetical protein
MFPMWVLSNYFNGFLSWFLQELYFSICTCSTSAHTDCGLLEIGLHFPARTGIFVCVSTSTLTLPTPVPFKAWSWLRFTINCYSGTTLFQILGPFSRKCGTTSVFFSRILLCVHTYFAVSHDSIIEQVSSVGDPLWNWAFQISVRTPTIQTEVRHWFFWVPPG